MRPLVFVLPHAIVFWIAWAWTFYPEMRMVQRATIEAKKEDSKDAGSIKVIMAANFMALFLAFPAAWISSTVIASNNRVAVFYAGATLLVLGSVLRRICWRTLGANFTGDVRARSDQPVIQTGPYRFVRHPSYSAGMMMYTGIGLALTNWVSLAILFASTIIAYAYRVRVEERALLAEIGAPYAEFMRTRKRFIPFIV